MVLNVVKWNPNRPSFGQVHSEHLAEFSWAENSGIDPFAVSPASSTAANWRCKEHGHHRFVSFAEKARYPKCPVCIGSKVLVGFNDAATTHADRTQFWDYLLNKLIPQEVTAGSNAMVYFKCENGFSHSYDAAVKAVLKNGHGCPFCSGHRLLSGFNDLATLFPHLLPEWDWERNLLPPDKIMPSSRTRVFWKCKLGHRWNSKPGERTKRDQGCATCIGRCVLVGFNDFATLCPELLLEWDWKANEKLPTEITKHSRYRAAWVCKNGHRWRAPVGNRTGLGSGCPKCSKQVSKEETAVYNALKKHFPSLKSQVNWFSNGKLQKGALDMMLEAAKMPVAIEYDGSYWHDDDIWPGKLKRDRTKSLALLAEGYRVIRLRQNGLKSLQIEGPYYLEIPFSSIKEKEQLALSVVAVLRSAESFL